MLAAVAGLSPGMMLGRYQVLRHLATGGMAEIFLARTLGVERFERYVVLKCIKPEYAANAQFVEMFLDEARISAQLHNHHIAQVFDMGMENGVLYFAMEYVHGQNAQAILQTVSLGKTFIPIEHALTIVIGAAQGLSYAHDKVGPDGVPLDLVHRDVTPTNILVSYDGAVKVVDFGIVKAATRSTHTQSGVLKGKIAYMSPEQCRSAPLDRRSDVFALGIPLELTTTHRVRRRLRIRVDDRIVTGKSRREHAGRAIPRRSPRIVMRCLEVDPRTASDRRGAPRGAVVFAQGCAASRRRTSASHATSASCSVGRSAVGRADLPPTPIVMSPTPEAAHPPPIANRQRGSAPARPVIAGAFASRPSAVQRRSS